MADSPPDPPPHPSPESTGEALRPAAPDPAQRRERIGQLLLLLWLPAIAVPSSLLMAGHLLTLPVPALGATQLAGARPPGAAASKWFALHVLAEGCGCSGQVLEHLEARRADPALTEKVLLVGPAADGAPASQADAALGERLSSEGYTLERITPAALANSYGIEGAPLLVVLSPGGRLAYSGGYARSARGPEQDVEILRALRAGESPAPLPLFGCAVSRKLQSRLDPLGLKYRPTGATP